MTTFQFEKLAKRAVCKVAWDMHNEIFGSDQISVVWMVHVLGNKKAILIDNGENNRLYEVTYNADKDELYVDEYDKVENRKFDGQEIGILLPSTERRNRQ